MKWSSLFFVFTIVVIVIIMFVPEDASADKMKEFKKLAKKLPQWYIKKKKQYIIPFPFPLPVPILRKMQPVIYKDKIKVYEPIPSYQPQYQPPSYQPPPQQYQQPDYPQTNSYDQGYDQQSGGYGGGDQQGSSSMNYNQYYDKYGY